MPGTQFSDYPSGFASRHHEKPRIYTEIYCQTIESAFTVSPVIAAVDTRRLDDQRNMFLHGCIVASRDLLSRMRIASMPGRGPHTIAWDAKDELPANGANGRERVGSRGSVMRRFA